MEKPDPKSFEVFCEKDECGDPVPGSDGVTYFKKRRMNYTGPNFWDREVYQCPVCREKRKFAPNALSDGYHEV